jgi:hypothetical protein
VGVNNVNQLGPFGPESSSNLPSVRLLFRNPYKPPVATACLGSKRLNASIIGINHFQMFISVIQYSFLQRILA